MGAPTVPRRVMVVGNGGSGKSTLANRIGSLLDLPVRHLDRDFWNPGWVPSDQDEFTRRCRAFATAERWVMDGNYSRSFPERIERADLIVFLDLPRRTTIPAALRRWLRWRGRNRSDVADGCPEKMDRGFLSWMWRYPSRGRPKLLAAVTAAGAQDRLVRLRDRRAVAEWLDRFAVSRP